MNRIAVLGDLNLDILATLPEEIPLEGEVRSPIQVMPGGSAGNFARAAAHAGAEVTFIGCVGDDLVGDLLVRSLQVSGIDTRVKRVDRQSGTIISLAKERGKTMICSRGANDGLDSKARRSTERNDHLPGEGEREDDDLFTWGK
jgi:ribokinase